MKKAILFTLIAIVVVVTVYGLTTPNKAISNKSSLTRVYMTKGGGSNTQTAVATTSAGVTYLTTSTATTTFPIYIDGTDAVRLDLQLTATSAATVLNFNYQYSNDNYQCDVTPTNCNWFNDGQETVGSNLLATVGSTTQTHVWTPASSGGANATSTTSILLTNITARYMRVNLSLSGANGAIWAQATKKIQLPN